VIQLYCPGCKRTLGVDDDASGALTECPACALTFRVPKDAAPPPPPSAAPQEAILDAELDDEAVLDAVPDGGAKLDRLEVVKGKKKKKRRKGEPQYRVPIYLQEDSDEDSDPTSMIVHYATYAAMVLGAIVVVVGFGIVLASAATGVGLILIPVGVPILAFAILAWIRWRM
jgi:hypothetical protein